MAGIPSMQKVCNIIKMSILSFLSSFSFGSLALAWKGSFFLVGIFWDGMGIYGSGCQAQDLVVESKLCKDENTTQDT